MNEQALTPQEIKAVKYMERLSIYPPYIENFKKTKQLPVFENFAGFYPNRHSFILDKRDQVEGDQGLYVYAIIHDKNEEENKDVYIYLGFSKDEAEDNQAVDENDLDFVNETDFYTYAYLWNRLDDRYSGLDYIVVRTLFGGLSHIKGE